MISKRGVPSTISISLMNKKLSLILTSRTTDIPIGFGLSGLLVAKTPRFHFPVSGLVIVVLFWINEDSISK